MKNRTAALSMTRRAALARSAKLCTALGLGLPLLGTQAGCGQQRRSAGQIGAPIPQDPTLLRSNPAPLTHRVPDGPTGDARPTGLIARRRWTNQGPRRWLADPMRGIRRITVHHDGVYPMPAASMASVASRIESIRRGHIGRGWADIGYHYVVDPAGRVWEGRTLDLQGAHVKSQNPHNLGIVVLGNFERERPTAAATETVDRLVAQMMQRYRVPLREVRTHREMAATACPGRALQAHMDRSRAMGGRLARM